MRRATAIQFCLLALLAGCNAQGELEQRTRRYFEIPASQQVSAATVRAAILNRVPLGSSVSQVQAYLERRGIGKDGLSSFYPLNAQREIVCRVAYNPKTVDMVKNSFGIFFIMGRDKTLKDLRIQEWRTGL